MTNVLVKDGETIAINDIYIYAGDLDENGEIEIEDLTNIIENYGEITQDNKDEKGKYDLNEDGIVNKLDRNILKRKLWKNKNNRTMGGSKSIDNSKFNSNTLNRINIKLRS